MRKVRARGFRLKPGPISTADKVRFCEALAETGLQDVQCVSFVDARRVPGMADAVEVAQTIRQRPDVHYTGIALNLRGYERAVQTPLHITGGIQMSTSNTFSIHNTNKNNEETLIEQRRQLDFFKARGIPVESAIVMTAFGCNFEGEIAPETVRDCVGEAASISPTSMTSSSIACGSPTPSDGRRRLPCSAWSGRYGKNGRI